MLESIFLLLAVIGVAIIVIMACIRGYSDKVDENTLTSYGMMSISRYYGGDGNFLVMICLWKALAVLRLN